MAIEVLSSVHVGVGGVVEEDQGRWSNVALILRVKRIPCDDRQLAMIMRRCWLVLPTFMHSPGNLDAYLAMPSLILDPETFLKGSGW